MTTYMVKQGHISDSTMIEADSFKVESAGITFLKKRNNQRSTLREPVAFFNNVMEVRDSTCPGNTSYEKAMMNLSQLQWSVSKLMIAMDSDTTAPRVVQRYKENVKNLLVQINPLLEQWKNENDNDDDDEYDD